LQGCLVLQAGEWRAAVPVLDLPQTRGELYREDPRLARAPLWLLAEADVRSLSHEVFGTELATPHVKWASPLKGAKIRLLVIAEWPDSERHIAELLQRLDAEITVIRFPTPNFLRGDDVAIDVFRERFLAALEKDYDGILFRARVSNLDRIGDKFVKRLHDLVRGGVGFVYVEHAHQRTHPEALSALLAMRPNGKSSRPNRFRLNYSEVVGSDHPAVRGIDYASIYGGDIVMNDLSQGAQVVAKHKDGPPAAAVGRYGKGRLVTLTGSYAFHFELGVPEQHGRWYRTYEQVYAAEARAVLWAAGREPKTTLSWDVPAEADQDKPMATTVTLKGIERLPKDVVLGTQVYDDRHQAVRNETVPAMESMPVVFTPPFRTGLHLLSARLLDAEGHVLDWVSRSTEIKAPFDLKLSISPESPPGAEVVTFTIVTEGEIPDAARIELRVADAFGRLLMREKASAAGPATFEYRVHVPSSVLFDVVADLVDARGRSLARAQSYFTCPRYGIDDYHVFIWPMSHQDPSRDLNMQLLREAGVSGLYVQPWLASDWFAAARHGMALWAGNMASAFNETHGIKLTDKHRMKYPPLSEGFERELLASRGFGHSKKLLRKFGAAHAALQDEGYCTKELSWDEFTITRFHSHLRDKYRTLKALNARWETTFKSWDAVVPSKTEEMGDSANVARWLEFRKFMDRSAALQMGRIRDQLYEAAGSRDFAVGVEGIWGLDWHFVPYGMYNFEYLAEIGRLTGMGPYSNEMPQPPNGGAYVNDLIRSLCDGEIIGGWIGYDHARWRYAMAPWWDVFHGDAGSAYFAERAHIVDGGGLLARGTWIEEDTRELRHGVGKLLMECEPQREGVGVYFNFANYQLAWILGRTQKMTWLSRLLSDGRAGIERAVTDLGLSPRYLTDRKIQAGALKDIKALILNGAISMAPETVAAIKTFVTEGGVLVADMAAGTYAPDGVPLATGALDDLFGIARSNRKIAMVPPQYSLGVNPGDIFSSIPGNTWLRASVYETGIKPTTATVQGHHIADGKVPAFLAREVGEGRTLYMNVMDTTYLLTGEDYHRNVWRAVCEEAGVRAAVRVEKDGEIFPFFDIKLFKRGDALFAGIIRSPRHGALIPEDVSVRFPERRHIYDVRKKTYLGHTDLAPRILRPAQPVLLAALPVPVDGIRLTGIRDARPGERLGLEVQVQSRQPLGGVVRVTVTQANGDESRVFTRNLSYEQGRAAMPIHLALNEPKGQWAVKVRDVVSGREVRGVFNVR